MTNEKISINEEKLIEKNSKFIPEIKHSLRGRMIVMPESIYRCSGIKILGKRIKSLIFTTDVAIINNNNAQATIAIYPFTPQLSVMDAIISTSSVPVFTGVGGRITPVNIAVNMAIQAELKGAYGVVVNAPTKNETIAAIAKEIDIALVGTVASFDDDYLGKIKSGVDILNISGGKRTPELIREIRKEVGDEFPIIATGGPNDETILKTIAAGANAITFTPPTSAEIFEEVMASYRNY